MTKAAAATRQDWNDLVELEGWLAREARMLAERRARWMAEDVRSRHDVPAHGTRARAIPPLPRFRRRRRRFMAPYLFASAPMIFAAPPSCSPACGCACACARVRGHGPPLPPAAIATAARDAGHAPQLRTARGRFVPALLAVAGIALAVVLVALADRQLPIASAQGLGTATTTTTLAKATHAEPSSQRATTDARRVTMGASAAKKPAARTAPPSAASPESTGGETATLTAPTAPTAPEGTRPAGEAGDDANANEARLEQAARTAAMLRAQLDASP